MEIQNKIKIDLKWHKDMPMVDYKYFADTIYNWHRLKAEILYLWGWKNPIYKVRVFDNKKNIIDNWERIIFENLDKAKQYAEMVIQIHIDRYL